MTGGGLEPEVQERSDDAVGTAIARAEHALLRARSPGRSCFTF